MKIIVPIKQVPETNNVKMDPVTGTMIREGIENIVNPLDLYAIETAIRLKEKYGGKIIVISMGPEKAIEAIKEAIAMGCDDGILLSDKKFAGSDTFATSYVVAKAIKELGDFDLVICGERATDGDTGQVGPGIASFLDLPLSTFTSEIVSIENGKIRVKRLVEEGYEEIEMTLPAVLTVVKEISDPRLPTLRGKLRAKKMGIPVWDTQKIGAEEQKIGLKGSPTRVVKIFTPKVTREGEKIIVKDEKTLYQAVDRIMDYLIKKELI
ncbi:Electron transfer flavoprotein, beta subunit [Thermoanaerobacter thermohydrosulfuricus WC1]|uniref:Electron transfer flavoprotein small subunit n=1 Tax=Thermoanaerobacter thermohydrosulfuricus WC1 TaxID=1198630 RepID=M8DRM2_THETY|nr:electron transfer flavoprotein subunit beta/FixA family protein [Thermoanaerobacter thermohydrosulfuricus]EMT39176.1 Electron transfer flavoprotein, beta subunit [Thermoanaerobacter thermohydrosulfuricus WC1]SFE19558.1 electron transfer flavoprotein beta subunit [Thermoanaerobacter thermohydrosulfuricus]